MFRFLCHINLSDSHLQPVMILYVNRMYAQSSPLSVGWREHKCVCASVSTSKIVSPFPLTKGMSAEGGVRASGPRRERGMSRAKKKIDMPPSVQTPPYPPHPTHQFKHCSSKLGLFEVTWVAAPYKVLRLWGCATLLSSTSCWVLGLTESSTAFLSSWFQSPDSHHV